MKNKNNYTIYGMDIVSEIDLPELLPSQNIKDKRVDVTIANGLMPEEINHQILEGKKFNFQRDKMWFLVKNTSRYYIANGNSIIVDPYDNAANHDVKSFLLGSAFGMLLLQRDKIAIHGSTIVVNNQAIIITGDQGAGKSTLSFGFRDKGYPFMSDDISVTDIEGNGMPMVHPGYPQQKLCGDAIRKMGYDKESYSKIDEGRDKYAIPVHSSFIKESMSLGAIIEITIADCQNVQIEEISGTDKLKLILRNIYRVGVTQYSGMSAEYFKKCIDIARNVPVFRIRRPKDEFSVVDQMTIIEHTLRKRNIRTEVAI